MVCFPERNLAPDLTTRLQLVALMIRPYECPSRFSILHLAKLADCGHHDTIMMRRDHHPCSACVHALLHCGSNLARQSHGPPELLAARGDDGSGQDRGMPVQQAL